ncbi:hypothetical protein Bpfe_031514 [Biomphalaria pfeifferi]|uniref:Uncharacterized protein n=1 Tax=Biomphalaria pfeifferi TaxID=112525 RepID=A0AAD8AML2_BIOPF|nr:hypothetical protein Bpfe_031514 [Biomphalaria pfeifferi]
MDRRRTKLHGPFNRFTRIAPPAHADDTESLNPIDAFLLDTMKANGLNFNPIASREELVRRLTFDYWDCHLLPKKFPVLHKTIRLTLMNALSIACSPIRDTANVGAGTGLTLLAMPTAMAIRKLMRNAPWRTTIEIMSFEPTIQIDLSINSSPNNSQATNSYHNPGIASHLSKSNCSPPQAFCAQHLTAPGKKGSTTM